MNTRKHPIPSGRNFPSVNFRRTSPKTHLSARKLAARLWHLRFFKPKLQSSPPRVKLTEQEGTKRANTPIRKLLRETKLIGGDSVLLSELLRAQTCINKLKAEHKFSKKKLEDEKLLWKRREFIKNQALLEDLKDKLARERTSRERMESVNAKLIHELAEAKLYAKQFMVNYKEEKRKRGIIEQVCNELAMQMGEDKARLEGIRVEMEEERNMFRIAWLLREESIQMKLLDAKLALEDKYNHMIHLIAHLQSFLSSRGHELGAMDAQLVKQAAESLNLELSYDLAKSNDVFDEIKIKESVFKVEPYYPSNLIGPSSTVHIVSLDEDHCLNNNANQNIHGLECCENAEDGCYEHSDSVPQQKSQDSKIGKRKGRLARNAVKSGGKGSGESGFRQWELLGQPVNPHITRGMKGCIEWPRGIPKINSKVIIPLEERVRKQKSQLQHILKPH
ncbi:hypothetical protein AAZX31_07G241500 [Glycine max]|uniref:Uncharacterized protein n=2 Tax=Glycine subgen. Soja TaxID=1462606 RepID=K7L3W7_SOYBN|nr:uncharacterized protein LOC102668924 [Glycine max]XP_028241845.1 uncharacterized protein LOC114420163 [Glycine soja]KAG5023994.1 hypothetical protein JHK85_020336 [Glycine max]KAG5039065.1 hypothetical protein JHK86_019905 [Glycine max]KAG5144190.1 hypothetical protein JHK82_019885 [Glycine max]KAH1088683.1 hypothetical protein GYH30_019622 [Glycine max]KAH1243776.1 hypothetical protein GmHk_07G020787 [Glycine max]|eukprot:XP_006584076.1 uncharacterized protein LOC102668924 [Glycine max]